MTEQERRQAEESWTYYRSAFSRRSHQFPAATILVSLIDRIVELGYADQLYAGASLDNLVISLRPNARGRRQTIFVIPRGETVEFRLYPKEGEAEVSTVARDWAIATLDCLLPRLAACAKSGSSGTAECKTET
jgi:hypothetical protein